MRHHTALSSNPAIHELYREFRISQGELYHYTCQVAATSISTKGELWLTRADSFLDETEVDYGAEILRTAIELEVSGDKQKIISLIDNFRDSLRQCYVFSVSSNPSNKYLLNEYGKTILVLRENFPECLSCAAWHSLPDGDGFNIHHFNELYEPVEGYVVYERAEQIRVARKVITLLQQLSGDGVIMDVFHVRQLLITCITLFKHKKYENEEEYRVVLHRLNYADTLDFNEIRESNSRTITYIKAQVAQFGRDCLVAIRSVDERHGC